jgi:hypothetical protein
MQLQQMTKKSAYLILSQISGISVDWQFRKVMSAYISMAILALRPNMAIQLHSWPGIDTHDRTVGLNYCLLLHVMWQWVDTSSQQWRTSWSQCLRLWQHWKFQ